MKLNDFQIRDPYILLDGGEYFMFGTSGNETFGGRGWDFAIFKSPDLANWEKIENVVSLPDDFWADKEFWAPEVYRYGGKYYMFMTCMRDGLNRGTHTFIADKITGPFVPAAKKPFTPSGLMCLDGTLYVDDNSNPYAVFSHEWLQAYDGKIMVAALNEDLTEITEPPKVLLNANSSGFCIEIGDGKLSGYSTDGPHIYKCRNGDLLLLWSSIGQKGYFSATARSTNGIYGPFVHEKILYDSDGGHCMIFRDKNNRMKYAFHSPNTPPKERAVILDIIEKDNDLFIINAPPL